MNDGNFEITEDKIPEGIKFIIQGRVNAFNADELEAILENALKDGHNNIILNMLRVEYLSSSGIRVILKCYKEARDAGGKLRIEKPSQNVKNVLGMIALDEMLLN